MTSNRVLNLLLLLQLLLMLLLPKRFDKYAYFAHLADYVIIALYLLYGLCERLSLSPLFTTVAQELNFIYLKIKYINIFIIFLEL